VKACEANRQTRRCLCVPRTHTHTSAPACNHSTACKPVLKRDATKGAFTLERLQAFGAAAAEGARTFLANDGGPVGDRLACDYRGLAIDDGSYDINETPARHSTIAYEWHASVGGHHEQSWVRLRCDNASEKGVPFPKAWHTALRCSNLSSHQDLPALPER